MLLWRNGKSRRCTTDQTCPFSNTQRPPWWVKNVSKSMLWDVTLLRSWSYLTCPKNCLSVNNFSNNGLTPHQTNTNPHPHPPQQCFTGSLMSRLISRSESVQMWCHPSSCVAFPRRPHGTEDMSVPDRTTGTDSLHKTHAGGQNDKHTHTRFTKFLYTG